MTALRRKISATKPALERDIVNAVAKATRAGRDEAKSGLWKDHTGNLRSSISAKQIGWSAGTYWEYVHSEASYSRFVNYDTKPHWIYPKAGYNASAGSLMPGQTRRGRGKGPNEHVVGRGRALRWKGADGSQHFASRVYHPGTVGFHYMDRAGDKARIVLINELHHGGFANVRSVWMH